jgi:MoxR-like ATPase
MPITTSLEVEPKSRPPLPFQADREAVERLTAGRGRIETELAKVIVGQRDVIEQLLIALSAGGHCLITGAPGLAKTLLVKSIAQIFHLKFQRIQFTPDLMPADITGVEILQEGGDGRKMVFVQGPVFANIISPTKSTAHRRRRRPRCSRGCRNIR